MFVNEAKCTATHREGLARVYATVAGPITRVVIEEGEDAEGGQNHIASCFGPGHNDSPQRSGRAASAGDYPRRCNRPRNRLASDGSDRGHRRRAHSASCSLTKLPT